MNNFSACRRKDTLHAFRAKIQFFSCTCIQKRCFLRIIIQSIGENRKKHTFLPHSNDFSAGKFSHCRGTALLLPWQSSATAVALHCCCGGRTVPRQRENFAPAIRELCHGNGNAVLLLLFLISVCINTGKASLLGFAHPCSFGKKGRKLANAEGSEGYGHTARTGCP